MHTKPFCVLATPSWSSRWTCTSLRRAAKWRLRLSQSSSLHHSTKKGKHSFDWLIDQLKSLTPSNHLFRFGPYFVSPVIAGLDKISETEYKPVICTYDSIGYREHSDIFEVAGTGAELLQGVCETFYKPNLEPEQLFEVVSNCLLSALDRDSLSGWGAYVYILTPTELIVRALKTRMDWNCIALNFKSQN